MEYFRPLNISDDQQYTHLGRKKCNLTAKVQLKSMTWFKDGETIGDDNAKPDVKGLQDKDDMDIVGMETIMRLNNNNKNTLSKTDAANRDTCCYDYVEKDEVVQRKMLRALHVRSTKPFEYLDMSHGSRSEKSTDSDSTRGGSLKMPQSNDTLRQMAYYYNSKIYNRSYSINNPVLDFASSVKPCENQRQFDTDILQPLKNKPLVNPYAVSTICCPSKVPSKCKENMTQLGSLTLPIKHQRRNSDPYHYGNTSFKNKQNLTNMDLYDTFGRAPEIAVNSNFGKNDKVESNSKKIGKAQSNTNDENHYTHLVRKPTTMHRFAKVNKTRRFSI